MVMDVPRAGSSYGQKSERSQAVISSHLRGQHDAASSHVLLIPLPRRAHHSTGTIEGRGCRADDGF